MQTQRQYFLGLCSGLMARKFDSYAFAWGFGPGLGHCTHEIFGKSLHPVVLRPVSSPCRSLSCRFTLSFSVLSLHPVVLCPVASPCRSLSCLFTLSFFVLSLYPVVLCPVSSPCRYLSCLANVWRCGCLVLMSIPNVGGIMYASSAQPQHIVASTH